MSPFPVRLEISTGESVVGVILRDTNGTMLAVGQIERGWLRRALDHMSYELVLNLDPVPTDPPARYLLIRNSNGDVGCPICHEWVNKVCWQCGWTRPTSPRPRSIP